MIKAIIALLSSLFMTLFGYRAGKKTAEAADAKQADQIRKKTADVKEKHNEDVDSLSDAELGERLRDARGRFVKRKRNL